VKEVVFAISGDLATPTGGYTYDRRIITELLDLGWKIEVQHLGDGFPRPAADTRAAACARLAALRPERPIVIDGLAFGALPESAKMLAASHTLIAHYPLELLALAYARHVIATSASSVRILAADYGVPSNRVRCKAGHRSYCSTAAQAGRDDDTARGRRGGPAQGLRRAGWSRHSPKTHLPWRQVIAGDSGRSPETFRRLQADIAALGLTPRAALLDPSRSKSTVQAPAIGCRAGKTAFRRAGVHL
jgi:hypothetical protein